MLKYKRVTIDISEEYAGALAVTAINQVQTAYNQMQVNIAHTALDLSKGRHIVIDGTGKFEQKETGV